MKPARISVKMGDMREGKTLTAVCFNSVLCTRLLGHQQYWVQKGLNIMQVLGLLAALRVSSISNCGWAPP